MKTPPSPQEQLAASINRAATAVNKVFEKEKTTSAMDTLSFVVVLRTYAELLSEELPHDAAATVVELVEVLKTQMKGQLKEATKPPGFLK